MATVRRLSSGAVLLLLIAAGLALNSPPTAAASSASTRTTSTSTFDDGADGTSAAPRLAAAAQEAADGTLVTYVAFDHSTHRLRQFNGRYTAALLTDQDLAAYTTARVRDLIDRYDILYAHFAAMLAGEPQGDGLLHVAFVVTCGGGCGYVGSKGIELEPASLDPAAAPGTDGAYSYVIHEMTHNFDLYSGYVMYGSNVGHAWTDFMTNYIQFYDLGGFSGMSPAEWVQDSVDRLYLPYLQFPGRTWRKCVRDDACDPANDLAQHTQGGVVLRLAQFYGPQAVKQFIVHLREAVVDRALDASKMSIREKSDLLIESLSYGAGTSLACFFDSIDWPVSADLRTALDDRFGPNPSCADADRDGYTPYLGDCDDSNRFVHPGAVEVANGVDDDCNGMVDDVVVSEPGDFANSSANAWPVSIPSHLRGAIASSNDADSFALQLASPMPVEFTLKSNGAFAGWLFLYDQGTTNWRRYVYVPAGGEVVLQEALGAGGWDFAVAYNTQSSPGAYEVQVRRVKRWLETFDVPGAVPSAGGSFTLVAPSVPPLARARAVGQVRFWVSRFGFVGRARVVAGAAASLAWKPPAGADPSTLEYRVQFVNKQIPVTPISEAAPLNGGTRARAQR